MEKSVLETLVNEGKSIAEIAKALKRATSSVGYWLKKYNLKTKNKRYNKNAIKKNKNNLYLSDVEKVNIIISKSQTKAEAIQNIFGFSNGTSYRLFNLFVKENKSDTSHFRKKPLKYKQIKKTCPVCKKQFIVPGSIKEKKKITCSYACANTHFRTGKENPNYKGTHYRTVCFSYHKKECIICGEKKIVSVHHFDENHNNNDPKNLIPLCPTHHQYMHSRYKKLILNKVLNHIEQFENI